MEIYQNLKLIREKANKTQQEIAEQLKTTQQQYWKYEKGTQEIPVRHIKTLAEYYKISSDELIRIKETRITINEEETQILKKYKALSEKRQGRILQLIDDLTEEQNKEVKYLQNSYICNEVKSL